MNKFCLFFLVAELGMASVLAQQELQPPFVRFPEGLYRLVISQRNPGPSPEPGPTATGMPFVSPHPKSIEFVTMGDTSQLTTIYSNGKRSQGWLAGQLLIEESPLGDWINITALGGFAELGFRDRSLRMLDWVTAEKFAGKRSLEGRDILVFRNLKNESDPPPSSPKVGDDPGRFLAEAAKRFDEQELWVDAKTRFPVRRIVGDKVFDFVFTTEGVARPVMAAKLQAAWEEHLEEMKPRKRIADPVVNR